MHLPLHRLVQLLGYRVADGRQLLGRGFRHVAQGLGLCGPCLRLLTPQTARKVAKLLGQFGTHALQPFTKSPFHFGHGGSLRGGISAGSRGLALHHNVKPRQQVAIRTFCWRLAQRKSQHHPQQKSRDRHTDKNNYRTHTLFCLMSAPRASTLAHCF